MPIYIMTYYVFNAPCGYYGVAICIEDYRNFLQNTARVRTAICGEMFGFVFAHAVMDLWKMVLDLFRQILAHYSFNIFVHLVMDLPLEWQTGGRSTRARRQANGTV